MLIINKNAIMEQKLGLVAFNLLILNYEYNFYSANSSNKMSWIFLLPMILNIISQFYYYVNAKSKEFSQKIFVTVTLMSTILFFTTSIFKDDIFENKVWIILFIILIFSCSCFIFCFKPYNKK